MSYSYNLAVSYQKLYGSNQRWEAKYGYHKCFLSDIVMF